MSNFILPRDQRGEIAQILGPSPAQTVTVSIGASSARTQLPDGVQDGDIVRVSTNKPCFIRFGDSTVSATGADAQFNAGAEYWKVPPGCTHIAVIQDGAVNGVASITALV